MRFQVTWDLGSLETRARAQAGGAREPLAMIGAFARKLGPRDRVPTPDEIQAQSSPPEGFVEKFPHEGGDVYVSPMLETLRQLFRKGAKREEPSEPATLSPLSENR